MYTAVIQILFGMSRRKAIAVMGLSDGSRYCCRKRSVGAQALARIIRPSDESPFNSSPGHHGSAGNLSLTAARKHGSSKQPRGVLRGTRADQEAQDITFQILGGTRARAIGGTPACSARCGRGATHRPKPLLVKMDTRSRCIPSRGRPVAAVGCICIIPRPMSINGAKGTYPKTATKRADAALETFKAMGAAPSLIH